MDHADTTDSRDVGQFVMQSPPIKPIAPLIWQVGALCHAVGDILEARFNPVSVRGEVSGFSRASSGHCYFSLKDEQGQLRCAMFRRAASLMEVLPRDGDLVEVRGRLAVYEPRGDLQLVVESLTRAGQGGLFEQFLLLKNRLAAQGLFDAARKRAIPVAPRAIGLVTSQGAAALHDVVTTLQRRVPHIPVVLAPSQVQGQSAPADLVRALQALQALGAPIDVILLVRGGGSMEDLWAFNDESLARAIVSSRLPIICGVGHETDFSIADFCADLRAPTPTAAAELAARPRAQWVEDLLRMHERLHDAVQDHVDLHAQRLDQAASRLGRPSGRVANQQLRVARQAQRLSYAVQTRLVQQRAALPGKQAALTRAVGHRHDRARDQLSRAGLRLELLDPRLVLRRGYAMLSDQTGQLITSASQIQGGENVRATLADGTVDLTAVAPDSI